MPVLSTLTVLERRTLIDELQGYQSALTYNECHFLITKVIEPILDQHVTDAVRRALYTAAEDVERVQAILDTPVDDVTPADQAWLTAPAQTHVRALPGMPTFGDQLPTIAEWLRNRA